ncbi:MAG: hypothetical protein AAGG01_21085, partial [Planctomycetota bacterium]
IGRLWASVGESTEPWGAPLPTAAGLGWTAWASALDVLAPLPKDGNPAGSPTGTPRQIDRDASRRATAQLIQTALADRRAEDAYRWLRRLGADDPSALAGLVPRLFPGVGWDIPLGPGGRPAPLADGGTLRPQLPPMPTSAAARGSSRRATCRGLRVGEATLDLDLKLDGSGVVLEFTHTGGPAATLVVELPAPSGMRLKSLYVDWAIQPLPEGSDEDAFDWSTRPIRITIPPQPTGEDSPGYAESFSLFARLDYLDGSIPTGPSTLPAAAKLGGLTVALPHGDARAAWKERAEAWSRAAGLDVRLLSTEDARAGQGLDKNGLRGITVRLDSVPDPLRLARELTSAIEDRRRGDGFLYR